MSNLVWSIALAAVGIVGLWLAGSQRRAGWAVGLGAQVAWLIFGVCSGQYGFVLSALAYGFVYARNLRRPATRTVQVRLTADVSQFTKVMAQTARATRQWGR